MSGTRLHSAAILVFLLSSLAAAESCLEVTDQKAAALVDYVRKEYKLDSSVPLHLANSDVVATTCYRQLTFKGQSPTRSWQVTMYLSPDQRYLSRELMDTTVDPLAEEERRNTLLMTGLVENKNASKGPLDAPVTIVEFADFECPYCRRLAQLLDQLPTTYKKQVRLVFHHLPLSNHAWARAAAEAAGCAQLQGSDAFWRLHDALFEHQQEISPDNVKREVSDLARHIKELDIARFESCWQNQLSLGLVFKDLHLAMANDVSATPTVFINGTRIAGIGSAAQLTQLLQSATNAEALVLQGNLGPKRP